MAARRNGDGSGTDADESRGVDTDDATPGHDSGRGAGIDRIGVGRLGGGPAGDRLRTLALGVVGTVALAGLLTPTFGVSGAGSAAAVGLVWLVAGGPYGYALGQLLVATLVPVPLDDPVFLPVQGALLVVCFGRLLASTRPVAAVAAAVGSLVVVGALLVVSLGSVASLWQTGLLFVTVAAVATALFVWYEPATGPVEYAR